MVTSLAGAWVALVVGAAFGLRTHRSRTPHCRPARNRGRSRHGSQWAVAERIGRRVVPASVPLAPLKYTQIGMALPMSLAGLLVWPPLAMPAVLWAWAVPLRRQRRSVRAGQTALRRDLPDVIDLFMLAFASNLNMRLAVEAVARSAHGRIPDALQTALGRANDGQRLHHALSDVAGTLGDAARPLFRILGAAGISPTDAQSQLAVIGIDARLERRRLAEIEARRVPVRLLFPLVVCVLPAFGLLTVVPVIVGSFRSFTA